MFQRKAKAKENRIEKKHQKTKRFWCRCAQGKHPYPSRTRWLRLERPMVLCWRRHGRAGGCQIIYGGVAQLGEHLPCKQGVKSSNLSISICWSDQKEEAYAETLEETEAYHTYLENRILNKNELNIQIRISRHPRPYKRLYGRNKLVNAKAFMKT